MCDVAECPVVPEKGEEEKNGEKEEEKRDKEEDKNKVEAIKGNFVKLGVEPIKGNFLKLGEERKKEEEEQKDEGKNKKKKKRVVLERAVSEKRLGEFDRNWKLEIARDILEMDENKKKEEENKKIGGACGEEEKGTDGKLQDAKTQTEDEIEYGGN